MMNVNFSYDRKIESAYIITLKDNSTSERLADRAKQSCEKVNMPYKIWHGFNGTNNQIVAPDHLKNAGHMKWFKNTDAQLSSTEIACALSHISLWCHCIEIDKPIVVLEHDAIMLKKISEHLCFNAIIYLGCKEQAKNNVPLQPIPIHGTIGPNYHFIWRAHAYAIDPQVAKNMVAYVLKQGVYESLDIMMKADLFAIVQPDLFAYDEPEVVNTTIVDRKKTLAGLRN